LILSRVLRLFADEGTNLERTAAAAGCVVFVMAMFGYWVFPTIPFARYPAGLSQTAGKVFTRELSASFWDSYIKSQLTISSPLDIESGSSADISVSITQQREFRPNPGYFDMALGSDRPQPQTLRTLQWPITISLDGEKGASRHYPKGTSLPVNLVFSAEVSGTSNTKKLILKLENFDGLDGSDPNLSADFLPSEARLSLSVNGETSTQNPRDDIVLTVNVNKMGIPIEKWEYITLVAGVAGFLVTCAAFTNFASRVWQRMRAEPNASWKQGSLVLPHGTKLRATDEHGIVHVGQIDDGLWIVGGTNYLGPSDALAALIRKKKRIKRSEVATYWDIKRAGDEDWMSLADLI